MQKFQLFYGQNHRRINELSLQVANDYLKEIDDFNLVRLNLIDTSIEQLIEEAQTLPFLSDNKAIIVDNAFIFTGTKEKGANELNIDLLISYIETNHDDTLIIFNVHQDQLDKRKKVTKLIQKYGDVHEVGEMNESELKNMIKNRLNEHELSITEHALNEFVLRTGVNYEIVLNELEKLILYGESKITEENIQFLVSESLEQNIFKLTDNILKNNKFKAIKICRDLILQNEEPLQLLQLITSQFRLLYQVKLLQQKGYQQDAIAKTLRVHPYRVKLAFKEAQKYSLNELFEKIVHSRNMDYQFKSTYLDRLTLFELYIMKI